MGKHGDCDGSVSQTCPLGRMAWGIVLVAAIAGTQLSAQQAPVKSVDPPSTNQADADKKKADRAQDTQAKKPADGQKPDAGKQADAKAADTPQEADNHPPSVTPSVPSITDTATLSAPGWVESDLSGFKNLNLDRNFGTPSLLKLTSLNRRLQYRLSTDGYIRQGDNTDGIGDTYFALQYLFKPQEKVGWDLAGRITTKIPTANRDLGGTQKFDTSGLLLASRDFTKWQFHGDFNLGFASLTRAGEPGADYQALAAASTTTPIKGGRWSYSNELVYFTPIEGQPYRVTTMHGFSFAQHRYEVYNASVQWKLHGEGATFQVLFSGSFFLGKLF